MEMFFSSEYSNILGHLKVGRTSYFRLPNFLYFSNESLPSMLHTIARNKNLVTCHSPLVCL